MNKVRSNSASLDQLKKDILSAADPKCVEASMWFFKTGEGQYGYGDKFIGLTVPQQRVIAKKYKNLLLSDIEKLLHSKIHEERLIALFILVLQFEKAKKSRRKILYDFYLANTMYINNWDLVDSSANQIVGEYLLSLSFPTRSGISAGMRDPRLHKDDMARKLLSKLAKSDLVWERRIAMVATFQFIRNGRCGVAFEIADILLHDKHDLIQKAVGWMLREAGKRCGREILVGFLSTRYKTMPRTTLRYAIEHFDQNTRQKYLKGEV